MENSIVLIALLFAVLQIILFFKIWNMTNEVSRIRELLEYSYKNNEHKEKIIRKKQDTLINKEQHSEEQHSKEEPKLSSKITTDIELYSWVVEIKTSQEYQVIEINDDNTYLCANSRNTDGINLNRYEIEPINN